MRLVAVELQNFRAYRIRTRFELDGITTLIGKNDIGKSTWLEAMEVFFNNALCEIERSDLNIEAIGEPVVIACEFSDLPGTLTLDAGAPTSLAADYLVTPQGTLLIEKEFDCGKSKVGCEVYVRALHPTAKGAASLLELKEKDLQQVVKDRKLAAPLKGNPAMRQAIWSSFDDLELREVRVPLSKGKEDQKRIWDQIERHLPMFALFQSDRTSRDSDDEVQNPLKGAIAAAISEVQAEILRIQETVREKAEEIARLTHDALRQIDPTLAGTLVPKFNAPSPAKWANLFSVGMETDNSISLNKRGSGVRRLILVSFFKAEAERRLQASEKKAIIYAIEEPETSQHPNNQRVLIESLLELATQPNCQVILTTHSPGLASELPGESIRFVSVGEGARTPTVRRGADVFGEVARTLGVTPDSRVRLLICVEGPTDVAALKHLSAALHSEDPSLPNLLVDDRVAFVPMGGGTLKHWVTENYLRGFRLPEVHIYDSDVKSYAETVTEVNARTDGLGSWATQTSKHEIECYLHHDAIYAAFSVSVEVVDHPSEGKPDVPKAFSAAISPVKRLDGPVGSTKAKLWLAQSAFPQMTAAMLRERDPEGEVRRWMERIRDCIARSAAMPAGRAVEAKVEPIA
jgi:predicted ATP-dependent endonuclease of OLD family